MRPKVWSWAREFCGRAPTGNAYVVRERGDFVASFATEAEARTLLDRLADAYENSPGALAAEVRAAIMSPVL